MDNIRFISILIFFLNIFLCYVYSWLTADSIDIRNHIFLDFIVLMPSLIGIKWLDNVAEVALKLRNWTNRFNRTEDTLFVSFSVYLSDKKRGTSGQVLFPSLSFPAFHSNRRNRSEECHRIHPFSHYPHPVHLFHSYSPVTIEMVKALLVLFFILGMVCCSLSSICSPNLRSDRMSDNLGSSLWYSLRGLPELR